VNKRLLSILKNADSEPVEFFLGLFGIGYGLWLLFPFSVWTSYNAPGCEVGAYTLVASIWQKESIQGAAYLGLGVFRHLALSWSLPSTIRALVGLVGAVMWFIVAAAFADWRWQSTATPIYTLLGVSSLWVTFRQLRERFVK
jgi:hypothetical protein